MKTNNKLEKINNMRTLKTLIIGILITISYSAHAQMQGSLTPPGLGGGTNANAAVYSGDGVTLGTMGMFTSKYNWTGAVLTWNTGWDFLGGKYSMGISQPVVFDAEFKTAINPATGFNPIQISWDLNQLKLQGNYTFLLGNKLPLNGHNFTLRATQYLKNGGYSLNGSMVYEVRIEKGSADREYGNAFVLEGNFSKHFKKGQTAGLIGHYNSNVTPEYFGGIELLNDKSMTAGIGLDASTPIGKKVFLNAKYVYDLSPNDVIRANKAVLGLFYKF
ncbi:hypothetical protein GCM10007028_06560 [Algibacter mikhailovii]|uniref:Outer membrane protein beta-barrel domain-containing protein n=2 Tax=Algibacter mikhailovii TaxID=425498 RepID=A0A918V5Z5_9FLAO|nr:hypothetical protein GCM10007028_06560 [Algibacter mikhailovii]